MGRTAEGWKLRWHHGIGYVRFRHQGRRREYSTGETDPGRAAERAAQIYAQTVSGRRRTVGPVAGAKSRLDEVVAVFLPAVESQYDAETLKTLKGYARAHWLPFWSTLSEITEASLGDYVRERLRHVTRSTVNHERWGLAVLLGWCAEQGMIDEAPEIPRCPKRATGVRVFRRAPRDCSLAEVEAWLAAMPERTPKNVPARARYRVAFETGLRPSTLDNLRAPEHYRRGAGELTILDEHDKARYGRTVPLSTRARAELDAICPEVGLIFGRHRVPKVVTQAAKDAGLGHATPYDLRHARATALLELGANLPGVAYLLGHKRTTTTDRYIRASRRAAEQALAVANGGLSGGESDENRGDRRGSNPRQLEPQRSVFDLTSRNNANGEPAWSAEVRAVPAESGELPPLLRCIALAMASEELALQMIELAELGEVAS